MNGSPRFSNEILEERRTVPLRPRSLADELNEMDNDVGSQGGACGSEYPPSSPPRYKTVAIQNFKL